MTRATASTPLRAVLRQPRRRHGRRALPEAAALVAPVLSDLGGRAGLTDVAGWRAHGASWTSTGTATFPVGPVGEAPLAVLRMSLTGAERLRYETTVLATLDRAPGLAELRPLLPTRRAEGAAGRWWYVLDEHLSGVDATTADARLRGHVLDSGVGVANALHRDTAVPVLVDDVLLRRWVDEPVDALVDLLRHWPTGWPSERLARLRRRLRSELNGRWVHAGWIHGDFWLGNLLVDPATGAATGLVDWDCAGPQELPAHDLLHLALFGIAVERRVNLGTVVAESLAKGTWPVACEDVLRHARWSWDDTIGDSTVLLLYWLRHVVLVARQQRDHVEHSVLAWRWHNVVRVLRCL